MKSSWGCGGASRKAFRNNEYFWKHHKHLMPRRGLLCFILEPIPFLSVTERWNPNVWSILPLVSRVLSLFQSLPSSLDFISCCSFICLTDTWGTYSVPGAMPEPGVNHRTRASHPSSPPSSGQTDLTKQPIAICGIHKGRGRHWEGCLSHPGVFGRRLQGEVYTCKRNKRAWFSQRRRSSGRRAYQVLEIM